MPQLLKAWLQEDHVVISWARNGAEALKAAGEKVFDLMLLDIGLPGMDGFEVLGSSKSSPRRKRSRLSF